MPTSKKRHVLMNLAVANYVDKLHDKFPNHKASKITESWLMIHNSEGKICNSGS